MTDFKIGDTVECIGTSAHDTPHKNFLKVGYKYNIVEMNMGFVKVVDDDTGEFCDYWFLGHRFGPLNSQPYIDHIGILKGY